MTAGVLAFFIACAFFWFAVIYLLAAVSDLYRWSKEKKAFIAAPGRLHRNKGLNWFFVWLLASPLVIGYLMLRQGKLGKELMAIYNGNGWTGIGKMLLVFYAISFFLLGPLMLYAWFPPFKLAETGSPGVKKITYLARSCGGLAGFGVCGLYGLLRGTVLSVPVATISNRFTPDNDFFRPYGVRPFWKKACDGIFEQTNS